MPVSLAGVNAITQQKAPGFYNVKDFGAVGDGVTDDRLAIQAALNTARLGGGGVVFLPPGTYLVSSTAHPVSNQTCCLVVGAHTVLMGSGAQASTIKLKNASPNQVFILINYSVTIPGSDQDIEFCDFTVDGNDANQSTGTVDADYGISLYRVWRARHHRVTVKNVFGVNNGGNGPNGQNGEGLSFQCWGSTDIRYTDCDAYADVANDNTSDGFAANFSTNVHYKGCEAQNFGKGHGFALFHSYNLSLSACYAYRNASCGFHTDFCNGVTFTGCFSGLVTGDNNNNSTDYEYPFPVAQTILGNGASGFEFATTSYAQLIGCSGCNNGVDGIALTATCVNMRVWAGNYINNGQYGIAMDSTCKGVCTIQGAPNLSPNTIDQIGTGGTPSHASVSGKFSGQPTVPASGTAFTNIFGVDCTVLVSGGTVSQIQIDGNAIAGAFQGAAVAFRIRSGGTITFTYTVAPTWAWFAEN